MENLDELYQDILIEHAKSTEHRGTLDDGFEQRLRNPLCGDEIKVSARFKGDILTDIRFEGSGCMISQASASMLASMAEGRSVSNLAELKEQFLAFIAGREAEESDLGDLVCLRGVQKFPVRTRCAILAFEALEQVCKQRT